jgi:hypothetical protein
MLHLLLAFSLAGWRGVLVWPLLCGGDRHHHHVTHRPGGR